jgi:3-oxoacyl-[acyl-carrier-protein] synthase III
MVSRFTGVRVAGIASAAPAGFVSTSETAASAGVSPEDAAKITASTGIERRHIAPPGLCTSDMAYSAAERLMADLGWEASSVDALIFISQTPDYHVPATACCLHARLGLSKRCAAFDVNLGCSGYVYGLWLAAQMCSTGADRVLLLVGDTASWSCSPLDRSVTFLFGDAGTATAIARDATAGPMVFSLGTDGSGQSFIMQPGGGFRNRVAPASFERRPGDDGNVRGELDTYMNGAEVFAFTLREVPGMIKGVLEAAGWTIDDVDAFVPHQANAFMLQHLAKRMKIRPEKLILDLEEFGNTSSASIPLALNHRLQQPLSIGSMNLVLAGFGVGWSWGAVAFSGGPMAMPDIVYLDRQPESVENAHV